MVRAAVRAPGPVTIAAPKLTPLRQVVVAPPRGGSANLLAQGSADAAGNTPVMQVPGPKPAMNGVQQAQPVANEAAPVPGGASGGGRSQMADATHVYAKGNRASASVVNTLVTTPLTWLPLRNSRKRCCVDMPEIGGREAPTR